MNPEIVPARGIDSDAEDRAAICAPARRKVRRGRARSGERNGRTVLPHVLHEQFRGWLLTGARKCEARAVRRPSGEIAKPMYCAGASTPGDARPALSNHCRTDGVPTA